MLGDDAVYEFYSLYGKYCFRFLFFIFLAAGSIFMFRWAWLRCGIASDGGSAGLGGKQVWDGRPVIHAENRRFLQGQSVAIASLASARDVNGNDITDRVIFQEEDGTVLSGYLDTERPGIYPLVIRVLSPVTGGESKRNILILVDGRVRT